MKTIQIAGDSKFGGASYLLIEWCRYLVEKGCEVHALTTDGPTIEHIDAIDGVRVVSDILIPREISPLKNLKSARELGRLLKREKYDVLHTYSSTPGFIGRLVGKRCRVPVVTHHQAGFPVNEFDPAWRRSLFGKLESMAINSSTKSICVSHAVRTQAELMGIGRPERLVTVCNGIEIEPFERAVAEVDRAAFCREIGVDPSAVLIAATGRLADQKGLTYLLKAVPLLRDSLGDRSFKIVFAGEGPCREALENEARELGISDLIVMLGFRKDIARVVASCDVFCSPSLWEGLSISIMEAMACTKPIVTTEILPNKELIEHEVTGLLVPAREHRPLADALHRVITDEGLARSMAAAGNERVNKNYTIRRMFDETWDLYNELLGLSKR